jgi:ubiquinone/menaquinone biosynthesis C-methylase UbiE
MDLVTKARWDAAAPSFDFMAGYGPEKRWEPYKTELFSHMGHGRVLFCAVGTGLDIPFLPPGRELIGIDISEKMLEVAKPRIEAYDGTIDVRAMDVHDMPFEDGAFDQVFTSCTFCSVPDPIKGLQGLRRVLKPGGELYMFEHTGSKYYPFRLMMNAMTPLLRGRGTEMNRDTVANVEAAGFTLREVKHVFLDVVKTIHATA